ncbi:signal peptidase I [Derxia gummosa]|uniref:Signal peptidase I n=1 Tax=Derxia gummosa DSM 723 TaxID=1121388 RepID=A0A8B6X6K2_9BURK|nr:signal peptidase I [Derxia gummosa]
MNFALILFVLSIVSGVVWAYDRWHLRGRRFAAAKSALDEFDARSRSAAVNPEAVTKERSALRDRLMREPAWVEYTGGFFPVIISVFLLRSFVVEPFRIPSGSMIPTLVVGDLILVNKFSYGIRLPVLNTKVIDNGNPQRGDVMVFRYPKDPSVDYIKRVVGVPGDEVVYRDKRLTVNGVDYPTERVDDYFDGDRVSYLQQYQETVGSLTHRVLVDERRPAEVNPENFEGRENCSYDVHGFRCKVPAGHYFMMGDNRDNSLDSRYWGFVPDANIVGKAFFVWMNLSDLSRIGSFH